MRIRYNCRFFKQDQPCIYHKQSGIRCVNCDKFSPVKEKILIIKLDSMGDVLRTTSLLPGLKHKYPYAYISWLTNKSSFPLLKNNPYIDRLLIYEDSALLSVLTEHFDIVINPSNDKPSCALASLSSGSCKLGFILDGHSRIKPLGKAAKYYFNMAIDDSLKKNNILTYQQIIYDMVNLEFRGQNPVLKLDSHDLDYAASFFKEHNIGCNKPVIGLNTGSGSRWKKKKWPVDSNIKLARLLKDNFKSMGILLGGPEEIIRNKAILSQSQDYLIDGGCNLSVGKFAALINSVDILVTTDTLALHIACALNKKVVCLFGPTSAAEIELYNNGIKLFASGLKCLCCYKHDCSIVPDCMELISPEQVVQAVKKLVHS